MNSSDNLDKIPSHQAPQPPEDKSTSRQSIVQGGARRTVERGIAGPAKAAERLASGLRAVQFQPLSKRVAEQRVQAWGEVQQCISLLFENANAWSALEKSPKHVEKLLHVLAERLALAPAGSQEYHLILRTLCFLAKALQAEGADARLQLNNLKTITHLLASLLKTANKLSDQTADFLLQAVAHIYENKTANAEICTLAAGVLGSIADRCELSDKHVPMMLQVLSNPPSRTREASFLTAQANAIAVAVAALERLDEQGLTILFQGIQRIHSRTRDAEVREACLEALGAMLEFGAPKGKLEADIDALYKRIDELL
ncbi:MAG TPA: hypothetical protein DIU37_06005 [Opitutae bacterium]|nr:hypothetical protein [Opitutae bacterium]